MAITEIEWVAMQKRIDAERSAYEQKMAEREARCTEAAYYDAMDTINEILAKQSMEIEKTYKARIKGMTQAVASEWELLRKRNDYPMMEELYLATHGIFEDSDFARLDSTSQARELDKLVLETPCKWYHDTEHRAACINCSIDSVTLSFFKPNLQRYVNMFDSFLSVEKPCLRLFTKGTKFGDCCMEGTYSFVPEKMDVTDCNNRGCIITPRADRTSVLVWGEIGDYPLKLRKLAYKTLFALYDDYEQNVYSVLNHVIR